MSVDSPATAAEDDPVLAMAATIIARDGVAGLTVRGLAAAIGASTQAIYTRYGGKPGLVQALAEAGATALGDRLAAVQETLAPGARVVAIAEAYCAYATAHPAVFELMFAGGARRRAGDALLTGALHPLRRAVLAMGLDITVADAVWAAAHGTTLLYLRERLAADQAQAALSRAVAALTATAESPPPPATRHFAQQAEPRARAKDPVASLINWIKHG
jgi:AcrR family transcriptional regulator